MLRPVMGADAIRFLDLVGSLYPEHGRGRAGRHAGRAPRRSPAPGREFQAEHPLILSPIWTQPPFPHGWDVESEANAHATMRLMRPVMPANLLGLPAAAVPAGKAGGLPVGVQVMGARFQELACLDAAEAIETALGAAEAIDPVAGGRRRPAGLGTNIRWRYGSAASHEGVTMRTTTTAVLAVGATALAIPTAAQADVQSSVQVPLAGHLTVASQMHAEHTELAQQRLTRKASRLADRVADARDRGFSPRAYRRRVNDEPPARLARRMRDLRRELETSTAARAARSARGAGHLPHARGDRRLRVRRQPGHGHRQRVLRQVPVHLRPGRASAAGNPAAASEAEQNRRAALLYAREGASPWPVCGR